MNAQAAALLNALDEEQREVATHFSSPVIVLAGAGTGKTRAMTHRIAYGIAT
ncbi:MAG: UvrD-helicase domain-containing protein, partial [Brevibacterium aurantiacum]|nr:UvrD-helicase domain-containing protein [Brevibacterium aurantiacum]